MIRLIRCVSCVAFYALAALPPFAAGGQNPQAEQADATAPAEIAAVTPRAIPTFECIGLYWKPKEAAAGNECTVHYRVAGTTEWKEALPMWFDPNAHPAPAEVHGLEYRGSIVNLKPDTAYEIQLKLAKTGTVADLKTRTRNDNFPIAKTIYITAADAIKQPFTITEGGSEKGYVLYTVKPGENVVFDGKGTADANILVQASHVILKGLTLKDSKVNGIVLGSMHDVVIDGCDISGWGRIAEDGWGVDLDSAVYSKSPGLVRLTVQNCSIHDPRSNSNCWTEWRWRDNKSTAHPAGPQGITCFRSREGQYVVRYNHIWGDLQHKFNDSMGEVHNFSFDGFPNRDSDVYGNVISNICDDGVEMEGADMNVRVWKNNFDEVYGAVGCATSSLGPIYIFRNVLHHSRKGVNQDADSNKGAYMVKLGNEDTTFTKGKIYIFHNTMLQPPARAGFTGTSGGNAGLVLTGTAKKTQSNITSRNNILFVRDDKARSVRDYSLDPTNDFDYDLCNGGITAREGSESHGIIGIPKFLESSKDAHPLAPGSPGIDCGVYLPNFNDDFTGKAPDMGAFESSAPIPK